MPDALETALAQAEAALKAGDGHAAFAAIRPALGYPGPAGRAEFVRAAELFAKVGDAVGAEEAAARARAAAAAPDDPRALYELGFQLIEEGLNDLAGAPLLRAFDAAPGSPEILTELACALERDFRHGEACRQLRRAPALVEGHFLCRYLLAFNALMDGDLDAPRALLPGLQAATGKDERYMTAQIAGMLARADAIRPDAALDRRDLRGWHYVLQAAVLLHLSPYGFDEGMTGRYAFLQDSLATGREGLARLAAVLEAVGVAVPRVFALPERGSEVMAEAAAKVFGVAVERWPELGAPGPGLIAAYDLIALEQQAAEGGAGRARFDLLREHRPGQVLFAHATCWTDSQLLAADATTLLYQQNTAPWAGQLGFDAKTRETVRHPPREEPAPVIGAELAAAEPEKDALADLPQLTAFARAAARLRGEHGLALLRDAGLRLRFRVGSPVPSSRFL